MAQAKPQVMDWNNLSNNCCPRCGQELQPQGLGEFGDSGCATFAEDMKCIGSYCDFYISKRRFDELVNEQQK